MSALLESALGVILATAAVCAAVGYLVKKIRNAARTLDAIETILGRELSHNHGSSMKDDIGGIAVAVGNLQRQVEDLETSQDDLATRVNEHLDEERKRP